MSCETKIETKDEARAVHSKRAHHYARKTPKYHLARGNRTLCGRLLTHGLWNDGTGDYKLCIHCKIVLEIEEE